MVFDIIWIVKWCDHQETLTLQINVVNHNSLLSVTLHLAGLGPSTLLKKRLWHGCFPVNFTKFSRTPFTEHLRVTASENPVACQISKIILDDGAYWEPLHGQNSLFSYFQAYSGIFNNIQPCPGILREITAYRSIFRHYWGI